MDALTLRYCLFHSQLAVYKLHVIQSTLVAVDKFVMSGSRDSALRYGKEDWIAASVDDSGLGRGETEQHA